jgi:antitoxin component YwqK of YwqJK toxin-antitoxin module
LVNDKLPESSHIGFNSIEITNFERGLKNGEINKIINNHIVFGSYKNDTVNGKWLEYTLGGYGQMESMFENGEILNPSISESKYYKEINYEFGVKNGVYESYTNGIIRERIYYKDDKYDGNYEIYDSNGNLITLKTYSEGKEIK